MATAENRASLRRQTRTHWLQRGEEAGTYWYAVEAVDGAPLDMAKRLPWDVGRRVMAAVALEVAAAAEEKTLPERLSTDHIWIDDKGDTKIVDHPVTALASADGGAHNTLPGQIVKDPGLARIERLGLAKTKTGLAP